MPGPLIAPVPVPVIPVPVMPPAGQRIQASTVLPKPNPPATDGPISGDNDISKHSVFTVSDGDPRAPFDLPAGALDPALAASARLRFVADNGNGCSDYLTALQILTEEYVGRPNSGGPSTAPGERWSFNLGWSFSPC